MNLVIYQCYIYPYEYGTSISKKNENEYDSVSLPWEFVLFKYSKFISYNLRQPSLSLLVLYLIFINPNN